jgi:protein-tyrosine phosphatase
MQANASFFADLGTRRRALSMLNKGYIQLVGSDAHNTTTRPPKIDKAAAVIGRRLGNEFLTQMSEYGYSKLL